MVPEQAIVPRRAADGVQGGRRQGAGAKVKLGVRRAAQVEIVDGLAPAT
jgi:hypothetical protein